MDLLVGRLAVTPAFKRSSGWVSGLANNRLQRPVRCAARR